MQIGTPSCLSGFEINFISRCRIRTNLAQVSVRLGKPEVLQLLEGKRGGLGGLHKTGCQGPGSHSLKQQDQRRLRLAVVGGVGGKPDIEVQ